ncbi:MAG TPA: M28 family peptidase [Candidatus Angelobacter sp.]|nr:M28 family peptidase [Candidatus Angelobacter sp.]
MNSIQLTKVMPMLIAVLMVLPNGAVAQKKTRPAPSSSAAKSEKNLPHARLPRDPAIVDALRQVSAQRIQQTIEKLVSFSTRATLSVNNPDAATSDKGIVAARKWIKSEFERYSADCGGCLEVKTDTFVLQPKARIPVATELQNVYAILHGTDPEQAKRIYLVTGHYDSRNSEETNSTDPAPGANDDGSGTAVSLECARVLSKHKFPATIIFLTVAGEEQGLDGSTHFAKMAKSEGWQLEGVLNNDIVGGNRTPGDTLQNDNWVRVFSEGIPAAATEADIRRIRSVGGENDSSSRVLARYVHEVSETYDFGQFTPKLIFRRDRYLRGGDHTAFNGQGFAAVRFTEYREDYNHQHQNVRTENGIEYGDLPKFVDFKYVANVARLNAATLASLASAPAPPAKVRLLATKLENDSKLEWQSAPGASAYEVLWRKTTDADFPPENVTRTSDTKVDLQQSKDNAIFAVRSVDGKGHRSLPVIPEPERGRNAPPER